MCVNCCGCCRRLALVADVVATSVVVALLTAALEVFSASRISLSVTSGDPCNPYETFNCQRDAKAGSFEDSPNSSFPGIRTTPPPPQLNGCDSWLSESRICLSRLQLQVCCICCEFCEFWNKFLGLYAPPTLKPQHGCDPLTNLATLSLWRSPAYSLACPTFLPLRRKAVYAIGDQIFPHVTGS